MTNTTKDGGVAFLKIDLCEGKDGSDGAFSRALMDEAGIDNATLVNALVSAMRPFALLLPDLKGVALVMKPDGDADIIGLSASPEASA